MVFALQIDSVNAGRTRQERNTGDVITLTLIAALLVTAIFYLVIQQHNSTFDNRASSEKQSYLSGNTKRLKLLKEKCRALSMQCQDQPALLAAVSQFLKRIVIFEHTNYCPISQALMNDPVTVSSGQTYDKKAIQVWLMAGNTICPLTRKTLLESAKTKLNTNIREKNAIRLGLEKLEREFDCLKKPVHSKVPADNHHMRHVA